MPEPLVSIVIDNFNYDRFLRQSIDSALAQTYPRTEVVVVDDGSTDGSTLIVREYEGRIIPVLRGRNGGQAAALNSGFAAAHGDIVIFLDSDDYLYPDALERVVGAWQGGMSKVHYRLDLVDGSGGTLDLLPPRDVALDSGDVVPKLLALGRYQSNVMSGNAFARSVLERILPIPEGEFRISADGYLVSRAPFHGPVGSLDEPLGAYRIHGANRWALANSVFDVASLADRLRSELSHQLAKRRAVEIEARACGLLGTLGNEMEDVEHLIARVGSLCLEPEGHPYPGDSRRLLGVRGALLAGRAGRRWPRRTVLAAWFLAAGLLPRPVASRAVSWFLAPATRPRALRRAVRVLGATSRRVNGSRKSPPRRSRFA